MAKKTWVSVKRGLLEPKHREKLGAAVWLYMYILDRADWEQGAVLEWTDGGAAEELGMDINTLRNHRRRLEDQGYISTQKKQHHQKLYIHNWTNPREYSGKVHNPSRQSAKPSAPSPEAQSSNQSSNESGNQSSNQPIGEITTLTYSQTSKVKHQKSIEDGGEAAPPEPEYVDIWEDEFNPGSGVKRKPPQSETKPMQIALATVMGYDLNISSNYGKVGRLARELVKAKYTPEQITRIYGPGGVWYQSDWRGKKGELPNMATVAETIGKLSGLTAKNTNIKYNAEEARRKALEAMGAG